MLHCLNTTLLVNRESSQEAERLFCCHAIILVHFVNSCVCILHLNNKKEGTLKQHRGAFFRGLLQFLNKKLLFFNLEKYFFFLSTSAQQHTIDNAQ